MPVPTVGSREFTLALLLEWHYICRAGGQRTAGPLVVGELHFARLACAPKSRPQTMRRAPRTARLGKLCLAGIGPLRARRFPRPTPARARRGGWEGPCQISRPTARFLPETASRRETRTTHRPTSYGPLPHLKVSDRRRPHGKRCPTLRWLDRLETAPKKPIAWHFE